MQTALIIGGGTLDPLFLASIHTSSNKVICADSGADVVWEAGIVPDLIIGDMDSISSDALQYFKRKGVEMISDSSPDHLDTELAIKWAVAHGINRIIILGTWGDRTDHSLASLSFLDPTNIPLSFDTKEGISFQGEVHLVIDRSIISLLRNDETIRIPVDTTIALFPLPTASDVVTRGFQFDLNGVDLAFGKNMSVSNRTREEDVSIRYDSGKLALIRYYCTNDILRSKLFELTGKDDVIRNDQSYREAITEIYDHGGIGPTDEEGKKDRLTFMRRLLDEICPDRSQIKIIHIAGTSGKGSTAHYLHSILSQKVKAGLLVSPHLYDFNERIQINCHPIPHSEVTRLWDELKTIIPEFEKEIGGPLLFQEIVMLMALTHFIDQAVQWAVVETGLGGRFDQTNALDPELSIITTINLDHTHILGETVEEIAREKAGIIRKGIPLLTAVVSGPAHSILEDRCGNLPTEMITVVPEGVEIQDGLTDTTFTWNGMDFIVPHPGLHQAANACLATAASLKALKEVNLDQGEVQSGLLAAPLPGRIEVRGNVIIDTAHNPVEIDALCTCLKESLPSDSVKVVVCGISDTKDHLSMVASLVSYADHMIFTKAGYRGLDPAILMDTAISTRKEGTVKGLHVEEDPLLAYNLAKLIAASFGGTRSAYIIVTGSTFLVDEIFNPDSTMKKLNSGK